MNLEIEAMIDVEVWMTDAPELFEEDCTWIAKETRASGIAFSQEAPSEAESFMLMVQPSLIVHKI